MITFTNIFNIKYNINSMGILNIKNNLNTGYIMGKPIYILYEWLDNNNNHSFAIISFETSSSDINILNELHKIYNIHNIQIIDSDFQISKIDTGILINHSGHYNPDLHCTDPKRYIHNGTGYGCFQIYVKHQTSLKPLFCLNNWNNTLFDIGLYSNHGEYKDWTFSKSSKLYQISSLYMFQKKSETTTSVLFGDSHAQEFQHLLNLNVFSISAASAKGICKLSSTLQLHKFILNHLIDNQPKHIYFKFGQVDIDYIYYTQNLFYKSYIHQIVNKYVNFVKMIQSLGYEVTVLNINPPTVKNNKEYLQNILVNSKLVANNIQYNEIYNTHSTLIDSINVRTSLNRDFNNCLEKKCIENKLIFKSNYNQLIDTNTGIMHNMYLNHDYVDHHINCSITSQNNLFLNLISSFMNKI